jgi:DNA-binding NarL/FixJ family response regulator
VTANVLEYLRSGPPHQEEDQLLQLSGQEQRILTLITAGKTNKEIAAEIHLSPKTVKNYVSSILSKLSVRRRSEAAALAARQSARN